MSGEAVVARRYARALHELIRDGAGALRAPMGQLAEVAAVPEVAALLTNSAVPAEAKRRVLCAIVKDLPQELQRLIDILAERGKLSLLPLIQSQLAAMAQSESDTVDVELIVATRLPAAVRNKITAAMESVVGRKLNVTTHQDKRIIGGFIVNIGDRRIDHSIRTRLNGMRTALAG